MGRAKSGGRARDRAGDTQGPLGLREIVWILAQRRWGHSEGYEANAIGWAMGSEKEAEAGEGATAVTQ